MSQFLTEKSFYNALEQECYKIDCKYTVYKVTAIFSVIITIIILVMTLIWTFKIPEWIKLAFFIILAILILHLGYLIYQSVLISKQVYF